MTPARHINPELAALEAQWWKDWWAADYSWDGLAHKSCGIEFDDGPLNLQGYWRNEESRLITEPGTNRRWTRIHCPFVFADGTPSPKSNWSQEDWEKLHGEFPHIAIEQTLLLQGSVLHAPPSSEDAMTLKWANSYIWGDLGLGKFSSCLLDGSWIGGAIHFPDNVGDLWCDKCVFVGEVKGSFTKFASASFRQSLFAGKFDLSRAVFGDVEANFSGARFVEDAEFSDAVFKGNALFEKAKFTGTGWSAANFFGARFGNRAIFDGVQCLDDINFYKAAFVRRLSINNAIFYGRLNLEGITDSDPISQTPQTIELKAVNRSGVSGLSGTLDPSQGPSHASFQSIPKLLARGAVFYEDANFSNRDLLSPSTFERSRFHHRARFHGSDIHANVNMHATRFRDALRYRAGSPPKYPDDLLKLRYLSEPAATFAAWKKSYIKARIDHRKADYNHDSYFDGLEASFRTLKQMMEDRRDRVREGEFFNLELRARRRRSDVPWWERAASFLYWLVSDYGNSIVRPLAMLIVVFVASAYTYYALGEAGPFSAWHEPDHLLSAFGFSLRNVFAPFSLFGADNFNEADLWSQAVVLTADPGFSLLIRSIASIQSLVSLALVFLAGLAGRRRFQIN